MGNESESVVLGPNEVDAEYRPNVSYVGFEPEAKSPSEMSDVQMLQTPEGAREQELEKEEITGEEKKIEAPAKEKEPSEKPSGEKEAEPEAEAKAKAEKAKTEKQEAYSKKVQKRINRETFKTKEAIRRAERAEAKLKEQEGAIRKATTDKAKAEILNKKPIETDFESEAEYYEALGRWSTRSEMLEIESERSTETTTDDAPPAPTADLPPEVEAMLELGAETYDDFGSVVDSAKVMPQILVDEAMETKELAHDIIYHLAKNQDEAARIAQLSPKAITREIGKIEAGLSASTTETHKETIEHEDISEVNKISALSPTDTPLKPKQTTNAPPPITPIQPGASTTTPNPNLMTNKEYRASRGFTLGGMKKRE